MVCQNYSIVLFASLCLMGGMSHEYQMWVRVLFERSLAHSDVFLKFVYIYRTYSVVHYYAHCDKAGPELPFDGYTFSGQW
jgi:hypothetical protein